MKNKKSNQEICICECGHYHNATYENGELKYTNCSFCDCQKFKPKKSEEKKE